MSSPITQTQPGQATLLQHEVHSPESEPPLLPPMTRPSTSTRSLKEAGSGPAEPEPQTQGPENYTLLDDSISRQEQTTLEGTEDEIDESDEKRVSTRSSARSNSPSEEQLRDAYLTPGENEKTKEGVTDESDPLRDPHRINFTNEANDTQELTVVVEDGDVVDSNGRLIYSGVDLKPSPAASRRASHLRLDLKPPSPQPWDLIDPPSDTDRKGGPDFYSTLGSRKFHTLQSTT
jgi:hypothetical protein